MRNGSTWCEREEKEDSAMSHIWARRLAYLLAMLVLAVVLLFAWVQGAAAQPPG